MFLSLMGQIVLARRAYYLCPACHAGHVPVDAALGLSAGKLTPAAEQVTTLAGTVGSFAEAAEKFLPRLAGLRLSESTVERTTEAAGQWLGGLWADGHTLGLDADWRWNHDAMGRTVAYVSIDATGVGIQGDGAARADGRMVWVGKVFSPRVEPSEAWPKPQPSTARYQAGLVDLDELGTRMRRQAAQVGMDRAERWVALTDGGNGLDEFMDVFFPRAVRILDFYHAAEHLGDLAKAYCGGDAEGAAGLAGRWSPQLKYEGRRPSEDAGGAGPAGSLPRHGRDPSPGDRIRAQEFSSDELPARSRAGLADRLRSHRSRVQDGGQPAAEAERDALGLRWADAVCHLRALYEGETSQWDAFWERSMN